MSINPTYNDRIRYILQSKGFESIPIIEPIGWRDDEKEFVRNKKYHGIFTKFSNSLKFVDDGADFIKLVRLLKGINAEIRLIREEKHPHTDQWMRSYDGFLDLSTYKFKKSKVSVKFNSSGLEKTLKSRESEKLEIERTDTIDGNSMPELQTKSVLFEGKRIFLETTFKENDTSNSASSEVSRESGEDHIESQVIGLPISIVGKSHEQARSVIPETTSTVNSSNASSLPNGSAGMMFFAVSDRDRILDISLDFDTELYVHRYENIRWAIYKVQLTLYSDGTDYNPVSSVVLYNLGSNNNLFGGNSYPFFTPYTQEASFNYSGSWSVPAGYSLALEGFLQADMENANHAGVRVRLQNLTGTLKISENSHFDPTYSKTILAHELGERLINIITNRDDAFYSEALGRTDIGYNVDGNASLTGFSHGHWVRGFDKLPLEDENKYKPFTTSFKDYIESLSVIWNLGLGIEKIGFKERIRIEDLKYFYNNNVLIRLPFQVKNVERSEADKLYYSGLEFGCTKGWDNEEAMGLDEYNAKTTFPTIISRVKNVYKRITKYVLGTYPTEFTRRKSKSLYPTEDYRYDKNIFPLDLKRWIGNSIFKERLWQDDFEQEPTGVFSPETASKLRYSPFNIMLRHSWFFSSGFVKYLTDYLKFGSSEGNSNLSTKLIGGNEYQENGNIINSELDRPRFVNEWIEFEHVVDFELMQQVEGHTTILGKKTPNFYGLVEFINEDGDKEKGYLFSLKPNNKGKWKLLKANR